LRRNIVFSPPNAQLPQTYRCVNDTAFCAGGVAQGKSSWVCPTSYQLNALASADGVLCYSDAASCAVSGANSCWGGTTGLPPCTNNTDACNGVSGYPWGCSVATLSTFISSPPYAP
jgi:hypothetical protein